MVTEDRLHEFADLVRLTTHWAHTRPDVRAVAVVGSWARGEQRLDSDVDLVIVVNDVDPFLHDDSWIAPLGGTAMVRTQQWGLSHERRFTLPSGLEVEAGFVIDEWTRTHPVDAGTRRAVTDGMRILYDPHRILAALQAACDGSRPANPDVTPSPDPGTCA